MANQLHAADKGKAVEDFQRALNRRAEPRFHPPVRVDGVFGLQTRYAYEALGFALGLMEATLDKPAIPVAAQRVIADPATRDAKQLERARRRAPKLHQQTIVLDGAPTFWGLAKPLLRARERGWTGALQSSDRRKGVAERYGKRSQASLYDCMVRRQNLGGRCPPDCGGNCNNANAPGFSSHECRSDGSAFGGRPRGAKLPWWELGIDASDSDGLLRALAALGYEARRTYPGSASEAHHINFTKSPGPVLPDTGPNVRPMKAPSGPTIPAKRVLTGVDVSVHQPDVDWAKVKAEEHTFAFAKVSEGLDFPDKAFGKGRWKAMQDAGLVRGAYHFAMPQKGRDPKDEVREFLRYLDRAGGLQDGDLLPVLDLEAYGKAGKLTPKQTSEWAGGFVEEMRARIGRRPIIYTGVFWREAMQNPPDDFGCPLWLAAYVRDPKQWVPKAWKASSFAIWQYTETGTSRGWKGRADLNRLPGGKAALNRLRL